MKPADLRPAWFEGADAVHLPAYSLLDDPLGLAGMEAIRLGRAAGARDHRGPRVQRAAPRPRPPAGAWP